MYDAYKYEKYHLLHIYYMVQWWVKQICKIYLEKRIIHFSLERIVTQIYTENNEYRISKWSSEWEENFKKNFIILLVHILLG